MSYINRHKFGSVLMIVFVGVFIAALVASTAIPARKIITFKKVVEPRLTSIRKTSTYLIIT